MNFSGTVKNVSTPRTSSNSGGEVSTTSTLTSLKSYVMRGYALFSMTSFTLVASCFRVKGLGRK